MLLSEKILDFLTASEPFAIESDFDVEESVKRLSASTKRPLFGYYRPVFVRSAVAGYVSAQNVSLWLERPFISNAFKPVFMGQFQLIGKRVILNGRITPGPFVYIFLALCLAISAIWTISALAELVNHPGDPANWFLPLFGPLPVCFGVGAAHLGKWLFSADVPWILQAIETSLREHPVHSA